MPHTTAACEPTSHYHAALAQLHRWYQIYEDLPNAPAHFDILSDGIVIDAATGVVEGLANLKPRFDNYKGWKNSHQVLNASVKAVNATDLELTADIIYLNVLPDGQRNAFQVHYDAKLKQRPGALPLFTLIKMRPTATLAETPFVEAYPSNRAKSFMHHWLYLMETGNGNASGFKPLLAKDFAVDLGGPTPATTWEAFEAWFKTVPTWLKESAHTVKDLNIATSADGLLTLAMQFDWHGTHVDGSPMIAKTEHNWTLQPQAGQAFAAMQRMQVKTLLPFQKVAAK